MGLDLGKYYKVKDKIFYNKIEAFLYANTVKEDVSWYYHNDVFSSLNWKVEPEGSLDDFYRARAKQIREKYDYVIIMCSGGADSSNVARTFVNNSIWPDELIGSSPEAGLKNFVPNDKDTSHTNTYSETKYAQLPLLNEIAQAHPHLKVTFYDWFEQLLDLKSDEWLIKSEDWLHPSGLARFQFTKSRELKNLAESGKKIAFVYGIDKPCLIVGPKNEYLTLAITDLALNVMRPPFDFDYPNVDVVPFYWAPDLPLMLVKQAHVLAKWIFREENKNALRYLGYLDKILVSPQPDNRVRNSKYERAIVPCIYPSTYKKVFQAEKPNSIFLAELDEWFFSNHSKTRTHQMIVSDTFSFIKKLDPRYLNGAKTGMKAFSHYYTIGKLSEFCKNQEYLTNVNMIPTRFSRFL